MPLAFNGINAARAGIRFTGGSILSRLNGASAIGVAALVRSWAIPNAGHNDKWEDTWTDTRTRLFRFHTGAAGRDVGLDLTMAFNGSSVQAFFPRLQARSRQGGTLNAIGWNGIGISGSGAYSNRSGWHVFGGVADFAGNRLYQIVDSMVAVNNATFNDTTLTGMVENASAATDTIGCINTTTTDPSVGTSDDSAELYKGLLGWIGVWPISGAANFINEIQSANADLRRSFKNRASLFLDFSLDANSDPYRLPYRGAGGIAMPIRRDAGSGGSTSFINVFKSNAPDYDPLLHRNANDHRRNLIIAAIAQIDANVSTATLNVNIAQQPISVVVSSTASIAAQNVSININPVVVEAEINTTIATATQTVSVVINPVTVVSQVNINVSVNNQDINISAQAVTVSAEQNIITNIDRQIVELLAQPVTVTTQRSEVVSTTQQTVNINQQPVTVIASGNSGAAVDVQQINITQQSVIVVTSVNSEVSVSEQTIVVSPQLINIIGQINSATSIDAQLINLILQPVSVVAQDNTAHVTTALPPLIITIFPLMESIVTNVAMDPPFVSRTIASRRTKAIAKRTTKAKAKR